LSEGKELIFVLEDDEDIALSIKEALSVCGFYVHLFGRATEFMNTIEKIKPSLVIIDIMLPDFDGLRVAKFIKNRIDLSDIPLIFLTAKIGEEDKIRGFEIGADDYITKPFSLKELVARVRAVLRRYKSSKEGKVYSWKGLEVNIEEVKVFVDGKEVKLTPSEFNILKLLIKNYGKPLSRDRIIEEIGGVGKDVTDRIVDVHIKHLREKLGKYGNIIKTVRGFGYKIES